VPLALLGVKLSGHDVAPFDDGDEVAPAVLRHSSHDRHVVRNEREAVDEVARRVGREVTQKADPIRCPDLVPPDVRDPMLRRPVEAPDLALEPAQPHVLPVLRAPRREQLHAQADSKEWLLSDQRMLLERIRPPGAHQVCHRVAEGADARQHQPVDGPDVPRAVHHADPGAQSFEGVPHRAQVAHSVVDDRDRAHGITRWHHPGSGT
jgi:hypothetical protein